MSTSSAWQVLGNVAPRALVQARLELHWAVQVITAAADGWLVARSDDGHTSMVWSPVLGALVSESAASGLAIAVRPQDLSALAIRDDRQSAALALPGRTLAELMTWADDQLAAAAGGPPRAIHARAYDMPPHPVGNEGARFTADANGLDELARWYGNAQIAIGAVLHTEPRATALRVWPHHFDLGAIVYLDAPGEKAPQLGIGMSPGDQYYAEPYFYVTPYPLSAPAPYPALASGGQWRQQDFTGAILTGTTLVEGTINETAQHSRAQAFLTSAIAGARRVTGSDG